MVRNVTEENSIRGRKDKLWVLFSNIEEKDKQIEMIRNKISMEKMNNGNSALKERKKRPEETVCC